MSKCGKRPLEFHQTTDTKTIADLARQYANGAELLDAQEQKFYAILRDSRHAPADEFFSVNVAHVVNLTFSIELYMKALAVKLMQRHAKTHDLRVLFDQFNSTIQKNIIDDAGKIKSEFDVRLEIMRDAFVKFRYLHQTKADNYPLGFAVDLLEALRIQVQ